MDAAAEAGLSPAKPDVHLGPNEITKVKQQGASMGLPPKSPHSKPGLSTTHGPAQPKHESREQPTNPSVRTKRDLSSVMEAADGKGSGPVQPSPYSTPTKSAKRAKTGRAQSASPSGPSATPEEFLQKLASFVVDMGGELGTGWDVDVKLRKNGGTAGTWDAYYIAPEGKRFRSRKEVAVYLGLIPGSDKKRRSSGGGSVENPWTIADRSAQPTRNAAMSAAAKIAGSMHDTEEGAAAAATAALEAALASRGASGSFKKGASDRGELAKQSKQLAASVHLIFPLKLPHGVVIYRLGTPVATPGFHRASCLYPPGQLVAWKDCKKTFTIFMSIESVSTAQAEGAALPTDPADSEADGDAGPPAPPSEKPLFTVTAVRGDVEPAEHGTLKELFGDEAIELASSHSSPDDVCNELFSLHKLAKTLPKASASSSGEAKGIQAATAGKQGAEAPEHHLAVLQGNPLLLETLQEAPMPPVRSPRLLFGLSHAAVLTKLEGHPDVQHCNDYMYVETRGGWKREHQMMLSEMHLYEAQALKAGFITQAELAAATPANPKPAPAATAPKRDPAAEAQAATIRRQKLHELAVAGGIYARSAKPTKKDYKFMDDVDKVLAKTVQRVDKALETEEQKKAKRAATREKKSEAMKQMHAARRAGVNAAAVAAGSAATGVATVGGFATLIVEDSTLPGATAPPPSGDVVLSSRLPPEHLSLLLQVWSFLHENSELLTIENVPSLDDLESSLFFGSLSPDDSPQDPTSTAAASDPTALEAAQPYLTVITPLLRLLAADVYRVVMEQSIDADGDVSAQQKDLAAGHPQVDATNWRHVCAGLFAGVALGQYLTYCKDSINNAYKQTSSLSGLPGALDPYLWIFFLTGTFTNTPALRPTVAFLPGTINQNTQECMLHCQSADAVAQAERMLAEFAAGPGIESQSGDATGSPGTNVAADILDRFYAQLPEAMAHTMCAEGDNLATAARVGRARGLLGLFALAASGVYQQPGVRSSKENLNGSANANEATEADMKNEAKDEVKPAPDGDQSAQHSQPRQAEAQRVLTDLEELLGIVRAAESRRIVPLGGEFEVQSKAAVSNALAAALEAARKPPTEADANVEGEAAKAEAQEDAEEAKEQATEGKREEHMTNRFLQIVQEVKSTVEHIHLEQPIAAQLGRRNPLATPSPCKLTSKTNTATNVPDDRQTDAVLANSGQDKDSTAHRAKGTADAHSKTGELTEDRGSAPHAGILQHLEGFERLAHLLTGNSESQRMTPEDYLNTLHALVVLAADTHAVRAALRAEHDHRDELSRQRHQLRMAITAGQKELKESSKTAGQKSDQKDAKNGQKGSSKGDRMPTRGHTEDPKAKLEADREQLLVVDAELQSIQVRLSPFLGQDRQRNDFWCLHAADAHGSAQPMVLCQEYSWTGSDADTRMDATPTTAAAAAAADAYSTHQPQMLFCEGRPAVAAAAEDPDVSKGRWMLYRNADSVKKLMGWLHSNGERERVLKARLKQVHAVMLASPTDPSRDTGAAPMDIDDAPGAAAKANASPPNGVAADSASPSKLGEALLALERSLHKDCLLPEYGTEERRESWRRFVRASTGLPPPPETSPDETSGPQDVVDAAENATVSSNTTVAVAPRPSAAMAAVLLLEGMVRAPWLRAFWRFWSLPLPAPEGVRTWAAVWHRLIMLRSAVRVGSSAPRTAELALFRKRGRGGGGGGGSTRSARRGASGVSGASGSGAISTAEGGHREVTGGRARSTGDNPSATKAAGASGGTSSIAKGAAAAAAPPAPAPSRRNLTAEIDLDAIQYTGRTRNKTRVDYNLAAGISDSDDEEEGGVGRRRRASNRHPPENLTREERARRRNAVRQEELEFEELYEDDDEEYGGGRGARTRGRRGASARGDGVRVTRAAAAGRQDGRTAVFSTDDGSDMDVDDEKHEALGASDGDADMMSEDAHGDEEDSDIEEPPRRGGRKTSTSKAKKAVSGNAKPSRARSSRKAAKKPQDADEDEEDIEESHGSEPEDNEEEAGDDDADAVDGTSEAAKKDGDDEESDDF